MATVRELYEKINIGPFEGEIRFGENMSAHTTFRLGGPADLWIRPSGPEAPEAAARVLRLCRDLSVPCFLLGGGANLVFSDRGIRGAVLDMSGMSLCQFIETSEGEAVRALCGTTVDDLARAAAAKSLAGLEFLAGMPGTVGGAVWMNARCYGRSVSDRLLSTEILDEDLNPAVIPMDSSSFSYKKSPFQERSVLILSATFRLERGDRATLETEMERLRDDREAKGHYRLPCAGSAFKNDYRYGKPTGQIVDELGLRGLTVGGAQVAPWHGNIVVNTGKATASDVRELMETVKDRVLEKTGLHLESEILFVGDWSDNVPPDATLPGREPVQN